VSLTNRCYLGLGSNIGLLEKNLKQAIELIANIEGVSLLKVAPFYLTKAWGKTDQQNFLNSAIAIDVLLEPKVLLKALQAIEVQMGRKRTEKWGPRIIDIDILLYADFVVKQPQLTIPHPYITERDFVLAPLYDLNDALEIPSKGNIGSFYNTKCDVANIIRVI